MTSIQLTLTGAQAKAEVNGLLTAGMVGVPVTIVWDESWNGLVKTLVCRSDGCIRTILNVGSQAMVAPEVFRTEKWAPNALYLGVEGRDTEGKLVIPSTFAYCGQILPGAVAEGAVSQEPENPAWAQILGCIGDMEALETTRKASLVEAINEAAGLGPSQGTATSVSAGYQLSSSHNQIPTGTWSTSVPAPAAGKYLWTKITLNRGGEASTSVYSVSGGVTSVNWIQPDSTGNIALTAAQTGAVPLSGGTMTGPLNLVSPTASAHGATKSYVDSAASKASPYNLLDNSDFRNPVNQRGKSSYSLRAWGGYFIDRWRAGTVDTTFSIHSGGYCSMTGEIYQTLPKEKVNTLIGKKVTIAAKVNGTVCYRTGTVSLIGAWIQFCDFAVPGGRGYLYADEKNDVHWGLISTETVSIQWVALYEGEYTTEALPEYRAKGYAAELAECQRYFYTIPSGYLNIGYGSAIDKISVYFTVELPVTMRITPTFSMNAGKSFARGAAEQADVAFEEVTNMRANKVYMKFRNESGALTQYQTYMLRIESGVSFSADL